jgi:hypothetical protein
MVAQFKASAISSRPRAQLLKLRQKKNKGASTPVSDAYRYVIIKKLLDSTSTYFQYS